MGCWKAGPEKPPVRFCWECSRKFHGRVHALIVGEDGLGHVVHKACVKGREILSVSTTVKP